jgi:hypothetical protein
MGLLEGAVLVPLVLDRSLPVQVHAGAAFNESFVALKTTSSLPLLSCDERGD